MNSWHNILVTLQKTEILFDRIRTQINSPSPTPQLKSSTPNLLKNDQDKTAVQKLIQSEHEGTLQLDLDILASALDALFSQSSHYSVKILTLT